MEIFIGLFFSAVIMIPLFFGIQYAVRQSYRDYWVNKGREWRLKGYDYFELDTPWIKKFFAEGYYEKDKRK